MTGKEFLSHLARQMVGDLASNAQIKTFTTNTAVIGAFAEAGVRRFIRNIVSPLRVCTGAVIDERLCTEPEKVPQIDTIIWTPSPVPAIFAVDEFGLVPRSSCFGILEIKRSCYPGIVKKIEQSLEAAPSLVADIVNSQEEMSVGQGYKDFGVWRPALAVICLLEHSQASQRIERLCSSGKVVVLLRESKSGDFEPDEVGVFHLVNFLIQRLCLAKHMQGKDFVNLSLTGATDVRPSDLLQRTSKRQT